MLHSTTNVKKRGRVTGIVGNMGGGESSMCVWCVGYSQLELTKKKKGKKLQTIISAECFSLNSLQTSFSLTLFFEGCPFLYFISDLNHEMDCRTAWLGGVHHPVHPVIVAKGTLFMRELLYFK